MTMRSNASNARRQGHGDRDIAAAHDIELHSGISSNAREAPTMRGCEELRRRGLDMLQPKWRGWCCPRLGEGNRGAGHGKEQRRGELGEGRYAGLLFGSKNRAQGTRTPWTGKCAGLGAMAECAKIWAPSLGSGARAHGGEDREQQRRRGRGKAIGGGAMGRESRGAAGEEGPPAAAARQRRSREPGGHHGWDVEQRTRAPRRRTGSAGWSDCLPAGKCTAALHPCRASNSRGGSSSTPWRRCDTPVSLRVFLKCQTKNHHFM
jgi:hypothetical protein